MKSKSKTRDTNLTPNVGSTAFEAINRLESLKKGWDSYGAPPIEKASRELAKQWLNEFQAILGSTYVEPLVDPTPEAGVALVWRKKWGEELDVLISPQGARYLRLTPDQQVQSSDKITEPKAFAREILKRFIQ